MKLRINRFLGIAPKIGATLLADNQAQVASNARLWSETLRAVSGHLFNASLSKTTAEIKTLWRYKANTDWLCWSEDVNVVRTQVAGDTLEKIYFTGTDKPRVTTKDLYDDGTPGTSIPPASYILGIPAPNTAPVATDSAAGNITATSAWVFTFVRKWSDGTADEGAPSPPSNVLTSAARQVSVTLPNGSMAAPGDYGITHKRLYRSDGGLYFFVAEVAIGTSPTIDNLATASLGNELLTEAFLPPPDGMIGLIELDNGVVAGFFGNTVYLSEPYRPWAFPAANQYGVAFNIVGIGGFGTTVVVATDGHPTIGIGIDPATYTFRPDRGSFFPCVSKRSMRSGEIGVFWASQYGIVLANPSGITLATKEFLTHEEFQRDYYPDTMHGVVHEGRYYGWFYNGRTDSHGNKMGGGIVLDRTERAFLTTHSHYVDAAYVSTGDGQLYTAQKGIDNFNQVFAFDADPSNPEPYIWKSKVFIARGLDNLGFVQIFANYGTGLTPGQIAQLQTAIAAIAAYNALQVSDGEIHDMIIHSTILHGDTTMMVGPNLNDVAAAVGFRYWGDGVLRLSTTIFSQEPVPMPAGFQAERHEFEISGRVEVSQISLASSLEELAAV